MHFSKTKKSLGLIFTLVSAITLSGCQNMGSAIGNAKTDSSADPRLTSKAVQHNARLFGSSGVGACAMGAVAGGLIGGLGTAATGGDSQNILVGAGAGAIAGCAAGVGANYYLEKQRTAYANKEDRLNATIKDVRTQNENIQSDINNAKQVIKEDTKKLAALNKKIKSKSIESAQLKQELEKIDANIEKLKENRSAFQKSLDNFQAIAKASKEEGAKTAKLDKEIAETQRRIKAYDAQIANIAKQRSAIKLG